MKLEKRQASGREKDEAAVKLLAKLREQLYSSNISTVRQSAFNLSWMQEDGLEILKEALFGDSPRRTKGAAAYGLRKMRGRMKKPAEAALTEGVNHPDKATAQVCRNALLVAKRQQAQPKKKHSKRKSKRPRIDIREISQRPRPSAKGSRSRRPSNHSPQRRKGR